MVMFFSDTNDNHQKRKLYSLGSTHGQNASLQTQDLPNICRMTIHAAVQSVVTVAIQIPDLQMLRRHIWPNDSHKAFWDLFLSMHTPAHCALFLRTSWPSLSVTYKISQMSHACCSVAERVWLDNSWGMKKGKSPCLCTRWNLVNWFVWDRSETNSMDVFFLSHSDGSSKRFSVYKKSTLSWDLAKHSLAECVKLLASYLDRAVSGTCVDSSLCCVLSQGCHLCITVYSKVLHFLPSVYHPNNDSSSLANTHHLKNMLLQL